jgi:hypothetical protein
MKILHNVAESVFCFAGFGSNTDEFRFHVFDFFTRLFYHENDVM